MQGANQKQVFTGGRDLAEKAKQRACFLGSSPQRPEHINLALVQGVVLGTGFVDWFVQPHSSQIE